MARRSCLQPDHHQDGDRMSVNTPVPTGWPDGLSRLLVITWPKCAVSNHGDTITGHLPGYAEISLHDWETGEPIVSATRMNVIANAEEPAIIAELTMCVGEDGLPLIGSRVQETRDEDGNVRTGVFRWAVAEMRLSP